MINFQLFMFIIQLFNILSLLFLQLMQQKDFVNQSGYRIKKHRNNYLFDDHMREDQDDVFKMSIHSSSNKTPLKTSPKKNNRQLSVSNKNSDHDKFSYRSKRSNNTNQNRSNMSSSNVSGGSRRIQQSKNIKQFANVKQLLMIKAYDKKLLRNVTGSSEANKNFLKLGDIRNDPFRKETFKVMIQNFKQLTIRIRKGYEKVLNKILFQNTSASAIHTLASVQPLLEKVRIEADDMCCKVKQCQQTHDSRQFRGLLQKFLTFLNAAQDIEQIILIVNDSKNRIDNLFKNLEKDKHLDDKVNIQRKKGIKKVRNAVKDYGIDGIQAQILNKVQAAINQMADKNLEAYSKINGARGLMIRIKQCLQENKQYYQLEDIVKINQIFKQVLHEAKSYERFVQKFMQEGDIVNDDLRACIIKYREQVQIKKQAVQTMQLKFIANILQTSINTFQANYSVCNAIDSTVCSDFNKVQGLLQSICELISNENAKINIKAMLKDISPHFKHIQKQIKKLKNTPKSIAVDTEGGLQTLTKLNQLINQYKSNIRQIVDSEDRAYRQITKRRVRRQNIEEQDLEQSSILKIIALSKKLSSPKRKQSIQKCKAFHSINKNNKIEQLAAEIGDIKFYKQFRTLYQQLEDIQHNNQISSLVNELITQQKLYVMSALFVDAHQIATSTTQQTLLKSIENINMKHKSNNIKSNKMLDNFIERIYCLIILKGLDKKTIKIINDNKLITFPYNQHDVQTLKRDIKYLKTVSNILPQVLVKNSISHSCTVMEQVLEGVRVSEELKWNTDHLYYVQGEKIFKCIADSFHGCFVEKKGVDIEEIRKSIKQICHNLQKLQKKEKNSEYSHTRVQRVIQIINRYEAINKKLQEKLKKIQDCQHLEAYAQLVFSLAQYLTGTLQSFNATLNKDGNVLWLCQYANQNPKYSKFGSFIGLKQLKPGQKQTKYNQKQPIKAKKEQPKQKSPKEVETKAKAKIKNKSNQIEDMDEQIKQDNQEMAEDMIEDMGQQIGDDMAQDMPEQNMDEQMDEQMDDQVEEDGLIVDVEDDIINDIDDSMLDSGKKDRNSKLTNKKQLKKQSSSPIVKKEPENPSPIKNEAKKQVEIIIKEKIMKKNLQKFKYIEKLQDLQVLLEKIRDIRLNYWKNLDLAIISQYLNRQGKDQIQKILIQELQKFCKGQYFPDFISSIKNSDAYKGILKEIDQMNCLKFGSFVEILKLIKRQYACLMGVNKQLLRLCIKKDEKWKASQCIEQYISKQLKIAGLKLQDFNTQQYLNQLITTNKKLQTKYELGDKKTQLKGQQLKQKVANIEKIIREYHDISKFPDGNNVYEMVVKMWYNCLGKDVIDIDVPKKLDADIDDLIPITNSLYSISYLTNLKGQANKTLQILKIHLGKLQHVLKTFKKENIQQKITQIISIYKIDKIHTILFEGHPIFIRQIISSSFSKPELKAIKSILLPQDKSKTELKAEQIRSKLKSQPQLFAQFHKQISIILSMLEIQCHIWPSSTVLHISQNRDDTIKIIVNTISNGIIKDAQQELENINQIYKSLIVANHQPLIFEYRIKQGVSLMSAKKNQEYYKQYLRIIDLYKQKKNTKYEVGDTIFQNIFRLEDSDNSITTQIFDYTQTLSLLLKQRVFQDNQSIYMYHIPTQTKLQKIKKQIDSQVRLLLSIVQQPIQINASQPLKSMGIMQERNNLVAKWYKEHRKIEKKGLCQINICVDLQGKSDRQYTLYVGEIQDHMVDYFNKLIENKKIYDTYIKKHVNIKSVSEWKQSRTIHIGKITRQISNKLKNMDTDMYCNFINHYNLIHFIKNQKKNKNLLELYNQLIKQIQSKIQIIKIVQQVVQKLKKNGVIGKLFQQNLEGHLGSTLTAMGKNFIQEKQKLSQVNVSNTQYTKFGNWIINVVGKIHKIPFAILFDNESKQDLVCIIPAKTPQQLQSALKILKLPTQYTQIEQKHTYKKIHLNQQSIFFKFDETQISKQELLEFSQENFGIDKPETEQKQTWVLGIYRKIHLTDQEDENLLLILPLDQDLIQKLKEIQLNINQTEIKAEIQFKILQVKIKKGQKAQEDGIIRQLNSQKYANVYLNDNLTITALPRWLKNQLKKLRDKKKAEKEKAELLLKQQKQKEEEQKRKQQERKKLEQQKKKKQEQQAKKKQEQQKKKLAQIPTNSNFILDQPADHSLIQKQSSLYLDKIYKQLTDKQIYTIDKKEVKQKKAKKDHAGIKLNSNKNIELKTSTQKIINDMQSILEGQVQKQFHRIASIYLESVDDLLYNRQQILNEIFKMAMQMKQQPQENIQSQYIFSALQENLDKIIDQLSTRENYSQNIKPRIKKSISLLSKQKKQKLYSIYQKQNSI